MGANAGWHPAVTATLASVASENVDPNQTLPFLSVALTMPSVRVTAWADKSLPMPEIPLTPGLAAVADRLLEILFRYTGNPDIAGFSAAIQRGDRTALNALEHIVNDVREVLPTLAENCQTRFRDGDYQAVSGQAPDIAGLAAVVGDDAAAAVAYTVAARSFWKFQDAARTVAMYQLAIPAAERRQPALNALLAACHDNLALALTDLDRLDEAIAHFQRSAELETNPDGQLNIANNLALAFSRIGEYALAAHQHETVYTELARRDTDSVRLAVTLDNWAVSLIDDGHVADAVTLLERAAPMFPREALDARRRNASNRVSAYNLVDRHDDAARAFRETWDLAMENARRLDIDHFRAGYRTALGNLLPRDTTAWNHVGAAFHALKDHQWELALQHFVEAATLARDANDWLTFLRCRANIAAILADAQHVDDAWNECQAVQRAALQAGLALPVALTAVTMASILRGGSDQGGGAQALAISAQGLAYSQLRDQLAGEADLPPDHMERIEQVDVGVLLAQVAAAAREAHAYDLAEENYRKAIETARRWGHRGGELNRTVGLLNVLDQLPHRKADADALADQLRAELDRPDTSAVSRLVVHRCLGARTADAQRSLPDLRAAATLLETIRAARHPGASRSDLDREYGVYRTLRWRLQQLDTHADEAFTALQAERARRLMETLTAAGGDIAPYAPAGVDEIQRLLARQPRLTTFVDITATDRGLRAYLVDRTGLRTVDVAGDIAALHTAQWGDIQERALHVVALVARSSLLAELAATITRQLETGSTVLLAMDDGLANLPVHAVPLGDTPWGEVVSIGRIPAAGVLRFTPEDRSWSGRCMVAGDSNDDLPGAYRECTAVADRLDVTPLTGGACTVDAVREALTAGAGDRLDLVHLAVHGRADARHGGRSSLLFAGDAPTWVPFAELAALPWRADLIVFSGCSTAVGGPRNGLGLYGVAQAAAEAGATTVIASLWPVHDASAELFMTEFYAGLARRRGTGVVDLRELMDEARARLRRKLPRDDGPHRDGRNLLVGTRGQRHPGADTELAEMLHWAPFVLIGEPTLVI